MADDDDEIMEPEDDVDPDLEADDLAEPDLEADDLEEADLDDDVLVDTDDELPFRCAPSYRLVDVMSTVTGGSELPLVVEDGANLIKERR